MTLRVGCCSDIDSFSCFKRANKSHIKRTHALKQNKKKYKTLQNIQKGGKVWYHEILESIIKDYIVLTQTKIYISNFSPMLVADSLSSKIWEGVSELSFHLGLSDIAESPWVTTFQHCTPGHPNSKQFFVYDGFSLLVTDSQLDLGPKAGLDYSRTWAFLFLSYYGFYYMFWVIIYLEDECHAWEDDIVMHTY